MHIHPPPMTHKIFSRIDCMLGHKMSLNTFKRIKVIVSIFFFSPEHNGVQLEIKRKVGIVILVSHKIYCQIKTRDREGHYMMIKGSTQKEGSTVLNI